MQIITTKNRSRSGKPIPGRNNHPSFVVLVVVLAKELIYKMAFSIKRLRYHLPKKRHRYRYVLLQLPGSCAWKIPGGSGMVPEE